jgi:hypothetical protein
MYSLFIKRRKTNKISPQIQKNNHTKFNYNTNTTNEKTFTYLIGDYGNESLIFITLTSKTIYIHKNLNYSITYTDVNFDNLTDALQYGQWETKQFEYISVFMSSNNKDMNGYEKIYADLLQLKNTYNSCSYMLVKLQEHCYLSLGFAKGRFIFKTPDNDIIKFVNFGEESSSRSGNMNAYLVGEKYTYNISDMGSDYEIPFYISNQNIEKYNLPKHPYYINIFNTIINRNSPSGYSYDKPYIKIWVKNEKKRLCLFTFYKAKYIYNAIYNLDKIDLGL